MQRSVHRAWPRFAVNTLFILGVSVQTATAEGGASGMAFLKLGISARGVAMADAMAASVTGASATYYNPAGLIPGGEVSETAEISLMHKEWIQNTRTEFLGAAVGLGTDNAIGFSLNTTRSRHQSTVRRIPGTFNTPICNRIRIAPLPKISARRFRRFLEQILVMSIRIGASRLMLHAVDVDGVLTSGKAVPERARTILRLPSARAGWYTSRWAGRYLLADVLHFRN